jgi:signal transduction histidine kinase
MYDVSRSIAEARSWDEALQQVLIALCNGERWKVGHVLLPDPQEPESLRLAVSCSGDERFRAFHELSLRGDIRRGQSLPGRAFEENRPIWLNDQASLLAALPVRAEAARAAGLQTGVALPVAVGREVVAVLEVFSNQPDPPDDQQEELMRDIARQVGRVLEREQVTGYMADILWREQQGLLHTLHDSLGQTLAAIGMLSTGLSQRLATQNAAAAETASQIATQAQNALEQVRQLASNLFPVEVDAPGLLAALRNLATTTRELHGIDVRVEGGLVPWVGSGRVAMELYRIAQEAVTNVVKHAQARTIRIVTTGKPGMLELRIVDDGIGIPGDAPQDGVGLRIMRHRADMIGAQLSIEPGKAGGTVVTCSLREPRSPTAVVT